MTERRTASTINDQELDALYERLEKAERAVNLLADSHRHAEEAEAAIARVMDLDVPDMAAAINPAYALGWKDALAIARGVLDPAQWTPAATGSEQS